MQNQGMTKQIVTATVEVIRKKGLHKRLGDKVEEYLSIMRIKNKQVCLETFGNGGTYIGRQGLLLTVALEKNACQLYLGTASFKFQSSHQLPADFSWLSSFPPGIVSQIRPELLPFTARLIHCSFLSHHSFCTA